MFLVHFCTHFSHMTTKNNKVAYREEVQDPACWCQGSDLILNTKNAEEPHQETQGHNTCESDDQWKSGTDEDFVFPCTCFWNNSPDNQQIGQTTHRTPVQRCRGLLDPARNSNPEPMNMALFFFIIHPLSSKTFIINEVILDNKIDCF